MDEKVKAFLDAKTAEEKANLEKDKQDIIVRLGIGGSNKKKVYVNDEQRKNIPANELFWDLAEKKHYTIEVENNGITITDEEYELLKKYDTQKPQNRKQAIYGIISKGLLIVAILVFIIGFLDFISSVIATFLVSRNIGFAQTNNISIFVSFKILLLTGVMEVVILYARKCFMSEDK